LKGAIFGVWLAALLLGGFMAQWHQHLLAGPKPLVQSKRSSSVLMDALGEGRTLMARFLYFKAEVYHEVLDQQGVAHNKQKDTLPLLRMVTYLDPSLTETFDIIAFDLWKGWNQPDEAIALLDEALRFNPSSQQLWARKALILFQEKRYAEAMPSIAKDVEYSTEEFEVLNANRLKLWAAKKLNEPELEQEALDVLLQYRPDDVNYNREQRRLQQMRESEAQ